MVGPVLAALGFGPSFEAQVSEEERAKLLVGRAVADRGRRLAVRFEDAERLVTIPGRLRAAGELLPTVGDVVLAHPGEEPQIARVLRRSSKLSRGAAGRVESEQVLAANVDVVFVVHGLDAGVKPRRLERELAAVHASGAAPVVVLTKADLADDEAEVQEFVDEAVASAAGAPVIRERQDRRGPPPLPAPGRRGGDRRAGDPGAEALGRDRNRGGVRGGGGARGGVPVPRLPPRGRARLRGPGRRGAGRARPGAAGELAQARGGGAECRGAQGRRVPARGEAALEGARARDRGEE